MLLREFWPKLNIIWANTGDAFPETIAFMERVRSVFGDRFIEARGDVETWRNTNGWPADIVPISHTHFGGMFEHSQDRPKIVPFPACCGDNFWKPMRKAALEMGATLIISGQKNSDRRKGPLKSGDVDDDGLEHWYPIQDWDDARVYSYLGAYLPPWYQYADTSLDCRRCTAYVDENVRKLRWMKTAYPEDHAEITRRLAIIHEASSAALGWIEKVRDHHF